MVVILAMIQEGSDDGDQATVQLEEDLGEGCVGNCCLGVSPAKDSVYNKRLTIALCEALASGSVVRLVVTLDVDGALPERVAESQLVAGGLDLGGRGAVRSLGGLAAAASLAQALEDVEAAGEGGNDGQHRIPNGPVVLLLVGHGTWVAQAVGSAAVAGSNGWPGWTRGELGGFIWHMFVDWRLGVPAGLTGRLGPCPRVHVAAPAIARRQPIARPGEQDSASISFPPRSSPEREAGKPWACCISLESEWCSVRRTCRRDGPQLAVERDETIVRANPDAVESCWMLRNRRATRCTGGVAARFPDRRPTRLTRSA